VTGESTDEHRNGPISPPTAPEGNFIPMAEWNPNNWPPHIHPARKEGEVTS